MERQLNVYLLLITLILGISSFKINLFKQSHNANLSFVNYEIIDKKTFYLETAKGKKIDSLLFYNLTFKVDSLKKINNSLWQFIYSVKCGAGCKLIKQVLITIKDNKIHIPFDFYLFKSIDFGDWADKNQNLEKFSANEYQLKGLKENKLTVEEINYNSKKLNQTSKRLYKVKYDQTRKLYYTNKIYIKGDFLLKYAPYFDKVKLQINDTCCLIKINFTTVTYIKDRWFWYDDKQKTFIEFL